MQGTCLGTVHVRKDLELSGVAPRPRERRRSSALAGAVVAVKPGVTVTLRGVGNQGGGRGILNRGNLALRDVVVLRNGADLDGAGIYNAAGGILTLYASSSIHHNTTTGAGGGVLNAGTLVLSDSSSIVHNVARDATVEAPSAGTGIDPSQPLAHPPASRRRAAQVVGS